jgi:hypothetical protein
MAVRMRSLVAALAACFALAACGGGGGGGGGSFTPGPSGPGSVSISPSALTFTGPGDTPKTFTVSSSAGAIAAPAVNASGCSPVAAISTSSPTLPATYTVTPTANGTCSFIVSLGTTSATVGVTVGASPGDAISGSANTVTLFAGGTSGTVSVTSSSGSFTYDATACNGIANVTALGRTSGAQMYSITPVSVGTCQFPIVSGAATFLVTVTVNPSPSGPAALQVSPTTMDFANASSAPQGGTLNFTGSVGQVSINEDDCIGNTGKPKIAFLTLNGVAPGAPISLPASFTVTLYGGGATGTCVINFIPQNGTSATLTITAH